MRSNSLDDAVRQCKAFGLTESKHIERTIELYKFALILYETNTPPPKTSTDVVSYLDCRRAEAYEMSMIYIRGEIDRIHKMREVRT